MLRYWARDLSRSWSKRIAALFIVLSMLLSDLVTFAEPNGSSTDTQTLICGRAEHRHTDACYEDVLVCGLEETEPVRTYKTTFSPHTHSEACYDKEGNLACGIMENEYYHKHNDFCKDADGNPICGLKFKKPHEHTEECFDADGNLICTTPILTHKHSAACYDDNGNLTCGQWEIPSFTSTADNLIETPGHHHDAGCYERRLTCGQEEHVHSPACYATEEKTEPAENADTVDEAAAEQPEEQTNTSEATEQTEEAEKDTAEQQAQTDNQPENTDTNTTVDASGNDTPEIIDATIDAGTESSAESTNVSTEETNNIGSNPENTEPEEKPVEEKTSEENSNEENASEENVNEENAIEEKPIYETDGDVLIRYNGDETAVTVPDGIRKIDKKAFYNNKTITTVILPDSVEVINSSAFAECSNLEKVILSNQSRLELIGPAAFKNDRKLDTSFAANVDRIVENAFAGIAQEETTEEEQTGEEEQTNTEEQNNTEEETRTEEQNKEEEQTNIEEQTREEAPTIEEDQTGEDNEPAEPEETEKTEESEEPEESKNQGNQEEPENPDELTILAEMTIPSDKDAPYQVTVTIPADAGIPEGTELVVAEQAEPQMRLMKSAPKNTAPMKLLGGKSLTVQEQTAGEETYASIPSLTEWQEGAEAPEIILYKKTLDISLVTADGGEIEPDPEAKITVSVNLPEIEDGQEVEVRHITDNGSEFLESTNDAGTITFTTNSFSLFEFTSTAQKLSSWTSNLLENTFFGKTDAQETTHEEISVDNVTEGLSVLEAFSVTKNSDLWMTLRQIQRLVLGKLESLTLYTVENGKLGSIVKDNITLSDILRFNLSDLSSFALVKDSGLRRKTQDLGNIILNGMMPKGATAEAQDVTEAYADIDFSTRLELDEKKEKNTPDSTDSKDSSRIENSQERGDLKTRNENKTDFSLLAAYDISILNGNEEYQPEEGNAITVEIQNDSIHSGMNLQLWHIKDDGTREQVKDFSLEDGKISFEATGFSVYALVYRIETYYVDAKGDTYHITVEYGDDADLPEDVELSVSEVDAGSYLSEAAEALKTQADYLLYRKFLDISFVQKTTDEETGEEQIRIIEPQAPVSVSVQLMDVTDGAEALQVVHFGKDGAEKLTAETSKEAVVTFTAPSFSVFGIGNVLQPLAATETENANIEILGFSGEASLTETQAPEMEEGLEVLGAFTLRGETAEAAEPAETSETTETTETTEEPEAPQETGEEPAENEEANTGSTTNSLWIKAKLKDSTELSEMESVVLYTVNGEETAPLIESLTTGSQVAKLEAADVAIVKDTGYRHMNLVLDMDENGQAQAQHNADTATARTENAPQDLTETTESETTEGQQTETTETTGTTETAETTETAGRVIILDGMMPKEAGATAIDVTEAYTDHEYVVEEEQAEEITEETTDETTEGNEEETVTAPEEENTETADPEEPAQELSTATQEQAEEEGMNTPTKVENTTADEATQPEGNESGDVTENTEENMEGTAETADQQPTRITLAAYDITLSNNESDYQPDETHPITVEIRDDRITAGGNIELWHIKDDGTEERIEDIKFKGGQVAFKAYGFSVYTIVEAIEPPNISGERIQTVAEISNIQGYNLSIDRDGQKYMLSTLKGNKYINSVTNQDLAETWYFEKIEEAETDDCYYIYCYNAEREPYYIQIKNDGSFDLSTSSGAVFRVRESWNNVGTFYINTSLPDPDNKEYAFSYSGSNAAFTYNTSRPYGKTDKDNRFERVYIYKTKTITDDYYQLNGKTFCIAYHEESVYGAGMLAYESTTNGSRSLEATQLLMRPDVLYNSGELLIAQDNDLSDWTFVCQGGNKYYLTTQIGGETKYLTIERSNLMLTDNPDAVNSLITVESGTGGNKGKLKLTVNGYSLTLLGGKASNGFIGSKNGGDYSWLNLVRKSPLLTEDDFVVYSAEKVDIADRTMVPDGAQIVVFARLWNETDKKYDFYVVNYDGTLIRCYESGDMIQWVGNTINTALWDFTEYQDENEELTYYYELQNTYSGKYIAPQIENDQILSDEKIGINLNGRRYGYYYSSIVAWDDEYYSYAGLGIDQGHIVPCNANDAEPFYYAIMKPARVEDELTTVTTLDHTPYGIKMKIKNFGTRKEMSDFLGNDKYEHGNPQPNLLSTDLDSNGYPTTKGGSLGGLYAGATEVNHLFIANTYYSSGYYAFDSSQNFASFYTKEGSYDSRNFTVYEQLGTHDLNNTLNGFEEKNTLKHGQFFPYNSIKPGVFAEVNGRNLYPAAGISNDNNKDVQLPDSNPRKNEKLYNVEHDGDTADYYFAMELEASFTQTTSGQDAWNHDIIYEFTGDDDFWLYVDGELIIDLGGIHGALPGTVNYHTGIVTVNGKPKTLREIFKSNKKAREKAAGKTEEEAEQIAEAYVADIFPNGGTVFAEYSPHTMKIFYMERGAGASNLNMRFNLASVRPGTVELSKQISGVDSTESFMAEYPYQIFFKKDEENAQEQQLVPGNTEGVSVMYKDTNRPVEYREHFIAADKETKYSHVFLLKPNEIAVIDFPDQTFTYRIVECFLNTEIYDEVYMNETKIEGTEVKDESTQEPVNNRMDFSSEYDEVLKRTKATFINHVKDGAKGVLTIQKFLFAEDGTTEIHDSKAAFTFRLYLGTENDEEIPLANMYRYHIKNRSGEYCEWVAGNGFVSLGKKVFDDGDDETVGLNELTLEERKRATFTTSMNGTIDKIPADYIIEIREIPGGTKYKVEERYSELPDGYSLQKYLVNGEDNGKTPAEGIISIEDDSNIITVNNIKGWGLRAKKIWSDEEWMKSRSPSYFALCLETTEGNPEILENTVTRLSYGQESVYWFIERLRQGTEFSQYKPYEVILTEQNPTVDPETGHVSIGNNAVTLKRVGDTVSLTGQEIGTSSSDTFNYTIVKYEKGSIDDQSEGNIRTDTITNKRAGIDLYKTAWDGTSFLAGAEFTLKDAQGNNAGAGSFTSDSNGFITTAYLRENENYTLTETRSPLGYQGMQSSITLRRVGTSQLIVTGGDAYWYNWDDTDVDVTDINTDTDIRIGKITIKNKPYTLQFKKTDIEGIPLGGVKFALYPQVLDNEGELRKDYLPIKGYESLISDETTGIIPQLTEAFATGALKPGTYYLYETAPVFGYRPLSTDIMFTISSTGVVTVDQSSPLNLLEDVICTDESTNISYNIKIPNDVAETVEWLYVKKVVLNPTAVDLSGGNDFTFTARMYQPNGRTPWEFTSPINAVGVPFINGIATFTLNNYDNDGDLVLLGIPLGAVVTIKEDHDAAYTTTVDMTNYDVEHETTSEFSYDEDTELSTITINDNIAPLLTYTNTRLYTTVNIKKTISGVTDGEFDFTVLLKDANQILSGYSLYTDSQNPENNIVTDENGMAQFQLNPQSNKAAVKALTIPCGAELQITEAENTNYITVVKVGSGSNTASNTVTLEESQTRTTVPITVEFTNTIARKLTITKQVTGNSPNPAHAYTFTLKEISGEVNGTAYHWVKTKSDQTVTNGVITKNQTFELANGEKFELMVPNNKDITIQEAEGDYTTTWKKDESEPTEGNSAKIKLQANSNLLVTNAYENDQIVAPTGHQSSNTPFLLLLMFGIFLLIGGGLIRNQTKIFRGIETTAIRPQEITTAAMGRRSHDYTSFCVRGYVPLQRKTGSMQADSVVDPKRETIAGQHEMDSTQAAKIQMNAGMNKNLFSRGTPWTGGGST